MLLKGETNTYIIFLTTEDSAWYYPEETAFDNLYFVRNLSNRTVSIVTLDEAALTEARRSNQNIERVTLPLLREVLHQFVMGELIFTEQDIEEIERIIYRDRN
jgi:hypothetical protein